MTISQRVSELWSGHEYMIELAMFNVKKATTPKVVTVHVFCILSHSALHLCEVSRSYLKRYQSYVVDTKL